MTRPWYPLTAQADGVKITVNRAPGAGDARKYERAAEQADRAEVKHRSLLSGVRILLGEAVSAPLTTTHEAHVDAVSEQLEALLRLAALADDQHQDEIRELHETRREIVRQLDEQIDRTEERFVEARRIASDALDLVKGTLELSAQLADVIVEGPMGGKGRSTPATRTARRAIESARADAARLERELFTPATVDGCEEAPY